MGIESIFRLRKKVKGSVEGISRGVVFGWVLLPDGTAPTLRIRLDGVCVGTVQPSIVRPDIAAAASIGHCCGFRFDLRPFIREFAGETLQIEVEGNGRSLAPTPMVLTNAAGWGAIDGLFGTELKGWAVTADPGTDVAEVEVLVDGHLAGTARTSLPRTDLKAAGVAVLRAGFSFAIPSRWHDGRVHKVSARSKGSGAPLRGGEFDFACEVRGHIDRFDEHAVSGWITNLANPAHPLEFDVWVDGTRVASGVKALGGRPDVESDVYASAAVKGYPMGFSVALPRATSGSRRARRVALCSPGTQDRLLQVELAAVNRYDVIARLESMAAEHAAALNALEPGTADAAVERALQGDLLPQLIAQLRQAGGAEPVLVESRRRVEPEAVRRAPVDVIIPVYKGFTETVECIESVLRTRSEEPMELVVINDCSPDAKLTAELRKMAERHQFVLLENEKNLGFVATVNRGMRFHDDRDVVLLNSDTLVPAGWLKGLRRAAYQAPNIATATPLSNRATIFSLPRTCMDNDMPLGLAVDAVHAVCAERNEGVVVDVPTAMGFCMYIRRTALEDVGLFDEERWAKGYAEENDFSLKASAMGWRHVAACAVFVQHLGSVSFDAEKAPRVAENLAKLNSMYPDYPERIDRFIKADPIALPRGRVNMAFYRRLAPSYVLFVSHGMGGGTDTAMNALAALHAARGKQVLILHSTPSGKLHLVPADAAHRNILVTEYPQEVDIEELAAQLRELCIEFVHYHHTLGFGGEIWRLPELLGVPYDVMLHDFFMACPRVNLIDESGSYCGEPPVNSCDRCVAALPLPPGVERQVREVGGSVSRWRELHHKRLQQARAVVAPSRDTALRFRRYLPDVSVQAIPHPEGELLYRPRLWDGELPFRVAVIGAIGPHKGAELLMRCAKYALKQELPLRFVVIGYTDRDPAFAALPNVEITGRYGPDDLADLVEGTGCTAALFLSVWPETFSYTLSEAWRTGLHPIALDIGAPAERIRETGHGTLVPFTEDAKAIVEAVMKYMESQPSTIGTVVQTQVAATESLEH